MINTIGNWSYAGTNKFVSHAYDEKENRTLCGMDITELMSRPGQEWEYSETEGDRVGCKKCNKILSREPK